MADPPEENGAGRHRPALPTAVVAVSVIVALVAVSGLLVVLFRRTTGPGEVLRDFARSLEAEDCPESYALLAAAIRERLDEGSWCELLPELVPHLSPEFSIGQRTFHEGIATIEVFGEDTTPATWRLRKAGRSWEILGVEESAVPIPFPDT